MRNKHGFSIPEVMVVMAIILMSSGLIFGNLFSLRQSTSLTATVDSLVADLKEQQTKAMVGDTEGAGITGNYGIHFEATRYILFHGSTYSSVDPKNVAVDLDPSTQFSSVTFPNAQVTFAPQSGDIAGFSNGLNTIILKDNKSTKQKTITINRYGTITNIN